jgi:3-deoxy-7-phosphoheptulonate synthase
VTFALIAGPCAVESRDQMLTTATAVADAGATMLRGGAFKPRTSPHSFRGLGRAGRPVLLKRGPAATLDELLLAAEYVLAEGNEAVTLCERGIRTFERAYRFTLDLAAVPVLKERTELPVIVDPSHAAGRRDLVRPLSLAAAAAGADGVIVEVHPRPDEALSDGAQALTTAEFANYAYELRALAQAIRGVPAAA